ncbi:MAG: protein-L-isoaspartate(D-aspartate) O-methyltransferase [Magnetococcales bacterium]|nr:protein-L-isoaspartate(D-aspartate) O-methyltransferase [Magnetococcales bacterium]
MQEPPPFNATRLIDPPATRPLRQDMIQQQLRPRGIDDPNVLAAMATIPREQFIPSIHREDAYGDGPLPIGDGQTISQPFMVAIMAQLLCPDGHGTVLEIGTGSGYGAAILSRLATRVITLERIPRLLDQARARWRELGLDNIEGILTDGTLGYPPQAPYEGICVTAAAPSTPTALIQQLHPLRGRLVIPTGPRFMQTLHCIHRDAQGNTVTQSHFSCVFVPLIGQQGWENENT